MKVAEPGQTRPTTSPASRRCATRSGPTGRVRVDANGGGTSTPRSRLSRRSTGPPADWSTSSSPAATVDELAAVRRRVDVPIAADESIRRADDPLPGRPRRGRRHRGAQGAAARRRAAPACAIAEQIGLPVVVSSALETSVGLAAGRGAGRRAARAAVRLRARDRAAAHRDVVDEPPAAGRRRPAGRARPVPDAPRPSPPTAAPTARWLARLRARGARAGSRVNPRRRWRRVLVHELVRAGVREAVLPRARATRRWPSRCTPPTRPAGCGCTCASTSAPPASSRSGWPRRPAAGPGRHDVGHRRREPAPGRRWRRTTAACRCVR